MDDIGESEQKISYYSVISALEIIANTKQQRTFKTPNTTSCNTFNTETSLKTITILFKKNHNKDVAIHFTKYSAYPSLPHSVYVFLNIN